MKKVFLPFAVIGVLIFIAVSSYFTYQRADCCLTETSDELSTTRHLASVDGGAMLASLPDYQLSGQMVWIPGGEFWMGDADDSFPESQPVHKVRVDGFWMDQYTVTNEEFLEFITQTGYLTVAERNIDPKLYPQVPAEMLEPGSIVFAPNNFRMVGDQHFASWWKWQKGASWKHPEGPQSNLRGREKYPVVQVAYEDAEAYAQWKGKRLPTEAEWEYAARGGLDRKAYAWGDELRPQGKFMANTWQGNFPQEDDGEDGFKGLAPVGSFPANAYGLYDMTGNVWQWTSDWYRPDYYHELARRKVAINPQGPEDSFDPEDPSVKKHILKGGSYLCDEKLCARYRPGARGKGDMTSGSPHVGFRLVQRDTMMVQVRKQNHILRSSFFAEEKSSK